MDDTRKSTNEDHGTRFLITCPASPVSPGPHLRGLCGAMGFRRVRALAGRGQLALPLAGGPLPPHQDGPFSGVAYPQRVYSRLGCSPKFNFTAAYHTTSCEFQSNTIQCPDKKSGGRASSCPAAPLKLSCSPVSAAVAPVREAVAPRSPGGSYDDGLPNPSIQEKD